MKPTSTTPTFPLAADELAQLRKSSVLRIDQPQPRHLVSDAIAGVTCAAIGGHYCLVSVRTGQVLHQFKPPLRAPGELLGFAELRSPDPAWTKPSRSCWGRAVLAGRVAKVELVDVADGCERPSDIVPMLTWIYTLEGLQVLPGEHVAAGKPLRQA
ncbi:MAG: hypothetical protein A2580_00990 [Hydrogenophilales bacterium RIFOXYD1_FULL_62_11]|nr:MAG: hypothetical protein A2580_00990 [Hydrogenophilales bacterium RIFOXYD1_FULL_62_11]